MLRTLVVVALVCSVGQAAAEPIRIHPGNPHYYLFRGKPTVLVTSAEHYGAVINRAFDYKAYLDALKSHGLNYTRIYPAAFIEPDTVFGPGNTLAPKSEDLIQPWARSETAGYRAGGNRFDLNRWDADYFRRLKDFVAEADARGIVVEVCLFNAQESESWPMSPLYWKNNIQGEGHSDNNSVQTLAHPELVRRQEEFVRRIVQEINAFDNVILEICDEPGSYGTPLELAGPWIEHFVEVIHQAESALPRKHLVAQQIQGPIGGPVDFTSHPKVSVIVAQYIWETPDRQIGGMKALDYLYDRNKPIDLNETGYYPLDGWYAGDKAGAVRVEAWEFIVGGGASLNSLNAVYTVRDPAGKAADNQPVLRTMQSLMQFITSFEFVRMRPDRSFVVSGMPAGTYYRGISEPGHQYALYHHHSQLKDYVYQVVPGTYEEQVTLDLPAGTYQADWVDPATGEVLATATYKHAGGHRLVSTPRHAVDVALRIQRRD